MARRRGQKLGELIERGGMWGVRYYVDMPEIDAETGKPKRERVIHWLAPSKGPGAKGKREVNRDRIEFMQRIDQFTVRPSSMRTLAEFVQERFQPDVVDTLAKNTRLYYRSTLHHILPEIGDLPLRDITPARIQALISKKSAAGLGKTVKHIRAVLNAVLRHAKAMQWFAGELPTVHVRLPEAKSGERRALTWEQVTALANALPEDLSTLVVLLTVTGMRIGEAVALRWKWVNLTPEMRIVNGEVLPPFSIAVRDSYTRGQYRGKTKTPAGLRNIPLPTWVVPRILRLLGRGHSVGPDDPVFSGNDGRPLNEHYHAKRLRKVAKSTIGGLPKGQCWHVFRHTNATLADIAGFSVTERQRILGHASEHMTMHYTKSDLERLRERLESMVDAKLLQ
jgi:integrase